ncbi:MAG: hypothetical protein DRI71_01660 [Bacteroidetes bacterium]|nr:MAG: hypothetical protein DRI71_01660 [Bacteroidota bacterium]
MKSANFFSQFWSMAITLTLVSGSLFAQIIPDSLLAEFKYRNVGPTRGGRATTVTGVASEPGTFYMGASGGGVWKTTDYGIKWKNVSDGFFASPSIGAMRVDPKNNKVIYVGTGSDGLRSNVITGKGVYKSTDAGKTWKFSGLKEVGQIGAVEIHPDNNDIIFVAAIGQAFQPNKERGVYRSKDGGENWQQVLYLSDTIGAVDLEFAPDNPKTVYATMWRAERKPWTIISGGHQAGGIYKSTDGGDNWTKLINGLPQGLIGKIDLAVSPADPDKLYALVEAPEKEGGLYVSNDRGENFTQISDNKGLVNRPFYYCNVDVNPQNANSVYVMAMRYFHSVDGGKTWKTLRPPHGDNHDMWMNPNDSLLFVQANDGGANVTTNGGKTWSTQFNQPTTELYQVEADDQYPYWLYAGQQDNSTTLAIPSLPPYAAMAGPNAYILSTGGCETGPAVPKPGNSDIVYSNCKGRFGVYNKKTGQEKQYYIGATNIYGHNPKNLKYRFQRVAPIMVSKHNPDAVYMGSQYLHKTMDDGVTWEIISPDLTAFEADKQVISGAPITRDITGEEYYSTLYSVRESPLQEGIIWTGANDGPVYVTLDGGKNWQNVTPDNIPKGGRVDAVEPSPHDRNKAYIAVLRYQLGDWKPYILRTNDNGSSWKLLTTGTNGIPDDYPVRVVREDPQHEGLLYAGTEFGMFISFDDGTNWQEFQQNLPVTPVTDVKVHRGDLVLSTMGRAFWILDDLSSVDNVMRPWSKKEANLFKPRTTYNYRYRSTPKTSVPYYPNNGVILDYYLPTVSSQDISLKVKDANGKHVRSLTSVKPKVQKKDDSGDAMGSFRPQAKPKADLNKSAGMHRYVWDMRHEGPWDKSAARSLKNGPIVAPGTYTFELNIDGKVMTQTGEIKADPRVTEAGITQKQLEAQVTLSLQMVDLISEAKKLTNDLDLKMKPLKTKLDKKASKKPQSKYDGYGKVYYQLVTPEGIYMRPMFNDQLNYLARMINRADQQPGKDAYDRYDELKALFAKIKLEAGKLK